MRIKYLIILCLFFCLVSPLIVTPQQAPYFVENLTTDEGLGSNKINDIAQDANGFLWIATSDGLNRFDGTEVVKYYHKDNENSLPHNYVYCLKALRGNNLAIGTQAGLSFYNSTTGVFRNFYSRQNNSLDAHDNIIVGVTIDEQGYLWAWSGNSIFIFDSLLQLIKTISSPFTEADLVKKRLRYIEKILPLSNGYALVYSTNGWQVCSAKTGLMTRLEKSRFSKFRFLNDSCFSPGLNPDEYFPASNVFKVFDKYFLYIKPCVDSLLLFNEQGCQISSGFFPFNKYPYILWSQQVSMLDSANLAFSFHNYGIGIIGITWQNDTPLFHRPPVLLFETYEYGNALRDRQGNWWLATIEEGLQKISPQKQYFKGRSLTNHNSGQPLRYDVASFTRQDNTLWIATYGDGFFKTDLLSGRQTQHTLAKTVNDNWANFTWNIRQVSRDTLWVGTQAGMFWYNSSTESSGRIPAYPGKPEVLDSVAITTQFADSYGLIWIGLGKGNGVCFFDSRNRRFTYYPSGTVQGYPFRYPIAIAEDKKGNLWFAGDASALVRWNRDTGTFQVISLPLLAQKQAGGLSAIWYEADSVFWLGTAIGGLVKFNAVTHSLFLYGHNRGLINSHISSIYKDKQQRLWVATDGGLSCFDPRTEMFTNYTAREGLPAKYLSAAFYYDTQQKSLYNGGKGIFFHFDPDNMSPDQPAPKTIITGMQVNGRPYAYTGQPSKFRSGQNDITIHYTAIDLVNGPATQYAYQLLGEDTAWIMAGSQRQINFSHLAPGKYTFMVRAANNSGVWSSETASIHFDIRRRFTQTAWFYVLLLLAMAAAFYGMYRFRLRQLVRTEQIRSEISRNLHDEVGSALTNISLGSLLAQKQLVKDETISRILDRIYQDSQNVSETMREIVWSINPKIDTLGQALPRMIQYASELLEAKDIELQAVIAAGIEHVKLSMQERRDLYLIFKEAVNNLAKHSKATQVKINFHLRGNGLAMLISDNGTGFPAEMRENGNGLKNMQERAQNHHWQLAIQSAPGEGTTIVLKAQIA